LLTNHIDIRSYQTESCSHTHDFAQLILPITGSMELEAGHYSGLIDNNTGMYIAPNERHCFAGSQKNLFLVIDITAKNDPFQHTGTLTLTASTKKLIQFAEYYLMHDERDVFSDSLVNQLLCHFSVNSFASIDQKVMNAKTWIDTHFKSPVTINAVAKHCHLSISQLQRRFKQHLGYSVGEYWRMKKLQHAKWLLAIGNLSIEAITFTVGYENLSAFSRRFSQVFGQSPSQWQNKTLTAKKMREPDNSF
jgi:AraC-like DNA-binding protein